MTSGIDYSFGRPAISAVSSAGHAFVVRYLSVSGSKKTLSRAEAQALSEAGLEIACVWQHYGDWAHDVSCGRERGIEHAGLAQAGLRECGAPPGRPVYFAVDFDPSARQMVTVGEYLQGVASVIGVERTGVYGGLGTIGYAFDRALVSFGWQTRAWSAGRWDPRAQLRQVEVDATLDGVAVDLNTAHAEDFGQWRVARDAQEGPRWV